MKVLFIWIILFSLPYFSAPSNFKIVGIQSSCNTNKYDSRERYIKLKKNNTVVRNNIKTRSGEFEIPKLEAGKYILEFKNIFGQICEQEIVLENHKKVTVQLCTDKFIDTRQTTYFNNITKDTLYMEFSSSGCFHTRKEAIKLHKENSVIIAQLLVEQKVVKEKILGEIDIEKTSLFFRKLQNIENGMGGCTTSETYILRTKGLRDLAIVDKTCDWRGFDELKIELF